MSSFENMECALVHIHIFKNAGTSLDVVLKNFLEINLKNTTSQIQRAIFLSMKQRI